MTEILVQKKKTSFWRKVVKDRHFILLMIPAFIYFFVFCYLPMTGIALAFQDYSIGGGFFTSKWVGLKWFEQFIVSPSFARLIRNTVLLNIYSIIFGFTFTIFFSLMLNEIRRMHFKKIIQTISYLPYFISTVIIVGLLVNFLSYDGGVVNQFLNLFGIESIGFMQDQKWFRTIFVASNVWTYFGFNSIIYISAISAVNTEIYEAAEVDGASRIQKIFRITLPSIMPTIIILLILNLGQIFSSSFEKVLLMYNPATYETADVFATYIYRRGIQGGEFSFAAAVGLFSSLLNFVSLIIFNAISRKYSGISLW